MYVQVQVCTLAQQPYHLLVSRLRVSFDNFILVRQSTNAHHDSEDIPFHQHHLSSSPALESTDSETPPRMLGLKKLKKKDPP